MSQDMLLKSLSRFYTSKDHMARVLPFLTGGKEGVQNAGASAAPHVSLRMIDWFVTNYARMHSVVITSVTPGNNVMHLNVYLSYRTQLKAFSKHQFDPFRRRERIVFQAKDASVNTTVGQLNFFRWLLSSGVLYYICDNSLAIERDMIASVAIAAARGVGRSAPHGSVPDVPSS